MLQVVSVFGAIAILGAFAADQFGWVTPSRPSYAVANLMGAGVLTVVAVADRQVGFVVLQGAWTLVSLWAVFTILLRGGSSYGDGSRPARGR